MNNPPVHLFPEKVYLSGADCFFLMLESNTLKHKIGNNVIRLSLLFENQKEAEVLVDQIQNSPFIHWLVNIELIQGSFYQKPYWKYSDKVNKILINRTVCEVENELPRELLNREIPITSSSLIECDHVLYPSGKVAVVLSWHHILMDGRGSGLLMRHLSGQIEYGNENFLDFFPKVEKKISFLTYVRNMYKVKHFIQRSSKGPIASIASKRINDNTELSFGLRTICFDEHDTRLIDQYALQNGARFGANNFLIAACAQTVHQVNLKRGTKGIIWIPIPYDGRKRGGRGPLVTNCISFLFYRLERTQLESIPLSIKAINEQMSDQIKMEMPKKYNLLLDMMRHIPIGLYRFLTTRSSKGAVSSFLFTSAGEGSWDMNELSEHSFSDILIIPPMTFPPGLTFSFLRVNNSLKMNIVYSDCCVNADELSFMETKLRSILVENKL